MKMINFESGEVYNQNGIISHLFCFTVCPNKNFFLYFFIYNMSNYKIFRKFTPAN